MLVHILYHYYKIMGWFTEINKLEALIFQFGAIEMLQKNKVQEDVLSKRAAVKP